MFAILCLTLISGDLQSLLNSITADPGMIEQEIKRRKGTPLVFGTSALFLAHSPQSVPRVVGDHNRGSQRFDAATSGEAMMPIGTSGWYYLTADLEPGSRIEYQLIIDGEPIVDPNNPSSHETWDRMVSELRLDGYPAYPELQEEVKNKGKIIEADLHSNFLNNTRKVYIYLPPGYNQTKKRYPTVYFNDGGAYVKEVRVPQILNWLIQKRKIKPVIGVFIDPVDRRGEYRMNSDFRKMMIREILPFVDTNYRTLAERESRLMVGGSRGGLCAADLVLNHPDRFAMCAPLAPALNPTSFLKDLPLAGEHKPEFFILGCRYDARFYQDAPQMLEKLIEKGYAADMKVIPEGHNLHAWSRSLDLVLTHFLGKR